MTRTTRTITSSTVVASVPEDLLEAERDALSLLEQQDASALLEISFAASDESGRHVTVHVPAALLSRYLNAQLVPGRQVLLFDSDEEISSEVAAQILGVSRPYLNELLDAEAVPYRFVGNQRRIRVLDIAKYQARRDQATHALAEMANVINESEGGWDS